MQEGLLEAPRVHEKTKFSDEFDRRVVSGNRRRGELDDGRQGCGCSVAHLVDRKEREEVAIADEGL
jgi:hypothetical protein